MNRNLVSNFWLVYQQAKLKNLAKRVLAQFSKYRSVFSTIDSESDRELLEASHDRSHSVGVLDSESNRELLETGAPAQSNDQGMALEQLSQEVRRVGRELFKATRASERNQELFQAALEEIRQMNALVAELPAQTEEAVFAMKASVCRELLSVADALEASLSAAKETLARLQKTADQPAQGIVFMFSTARMLRDSLSDSVAAMSQWHEGQQLVHQRLMQALRALGLRTIESVGRSFDPTFHHAVAVEKRTDVPAGIIVGEDLKGYLLDGMVLRYAEVIVAKNE